MSDSKFANFGDRLYTNELFVPLSLTARSVSINSALYAGQNGNRFFPRGMHCTITITNGMAPVDLTFTIEAPLTSDPILSSGALTALNAVTVLKIYPGILPVPNLSANDILPNNWRVVVVAGNANLITYGVECVLFA